ncbi:MAG: site-2 protease family protein [Bradymonadia bacterium]
MFDPHRPPGNEERPLTPQERRFVIWFMALLVGLLGAEVVRDFTPVKIAVVFFLAAYVVLTAIHEAGHAIMARLMGWRVERVVIGFGPLWKGFSVDGVPVELRMIPIGGYVLPVPERTDRPRLANALIFAAGPGAELAVVALLLLIFGWTTMTSASTALSVIAIQSVAAAALVGAINNLIPRRTAEGQVTDGLGILISFKLTREDLEIRKAMPDLLDAEVRFAAGDLEGARAVLAEAQKRHSKVFVVKLMAAELDARHGRKGQVLMELAQLARSGGLSEREQALVEVTLDRVRQL